VGHTRSTCEPVTDVALRPGRVTGEGGSPHPPAGPPLPSGGQEMP
jgi:hypothetical protein